MSDFDRRPTGTWAQIVILLGAAVLLGLGIAETWPWISDDAFISLRYAERFTAGQGLSFNDGERVEGYSNLLWILLCCALRPLGLDWVTIVRGIGLTATIAVLWIIVRARWLQDRGPAPWAAILPLAALAPMALWSIGGLEAPLAMLLATAGLIATGTVLAERDEHAGIKTCAFAGVSFALLAWTRPDGPLVAALACVALVIFARQHLWRRLFALGGPVVAAVLLQLTFRLLYYGDYVPNTAHVKVGFSMAALGQGLEYLGSAGVILRSLLVPAALGAVIGCLDRRWRPFALLCTGFILVWATYIALMGGDLFPLCRLLMPTLGAMTLLAALGFRKLATTKAGTIAAWTLAILSTVGARLDARLDPTDRYQQISRWEWRGKASGLWLGRAFGEQRPLLALDAAGAVPFYSRLPCLDMLGLNDRHIAKAPLPDPAHVLPGHSRGDGRYVLDRQPDLVLFATPTGDPSPRWPGAWQMESDPRFLRDYRCVVCRTGLVDVVGIGREDLKLTLWVRLAGHIALQAKDGGFVLPGYLLGSHRQPMALHLHRPGGAGATGAELQRLLVAGQAMLKWWHDEACVGVLDADNTLVGEFRRAGESVLEHLPLPPGDYEVTTEPSDVPIDFALVPADGGFDLRATVRKSATLPLRVKSLHIRRR